MMEGKRFGIGLATGVLLALALVAVSGGLGSTPLTASFGTARNAASTTTVATTTTTLSMTTVSQTATSTVSISSTTNGGPVGSLVTNATFPFNTVSSSSTTVTSTASLVPTTTNTSNPGNQSAGTSATNGTPYYATSPSGTSKPTRLASIAQQPIVSTAEIFAPVLVAFLLGAFLYRVVVQERERPSGE